MTNSTRCDWDVLIVDGTGSKTGESSRLLDALAAHGLRLRLDITVPPSVASVSYSVIENSKRAAYVVLLLTTTDEEGKQRTEFLAAPGPRFSDRNSGFASAEACRPPDSIEVGKLGPDVGELADRIARRLQ